MRSQSFLVSFLLSIPSPPCYFAKWPQKARRNLRERQTTPDLQVAGLIKARDLTCEACLGWLQEMQLPTPAHQNLESLDGGLSWVQPHLVQMVSATHCSLRAAFLKTTPTVGALLRVDIARTVEGMRSRRLPRASSQVHLWSCPLRDFFQHPCLFPSNGAQKFNFLYSMVSNSIR